MADCSYCGATSRWGSVKHLGDCDGNPPKEDKKPREMPPKGPFERIKKEDCPNCTGAKVIVYKRMGFWRTMRCPVCRGTGKR